MFLRPLLSFPKNAVNRIVRTLSTVELNELSKVRNIGIIAHVDAGKTTTTERMLYYSGLTENIGDVDKGNTVTDYMTQERERGITITSTPVQFRWNKHVINLIDTPGHVDFNYEVERCLTVLDGSVVILDASAGVEPQTYQVWKQSNNFDIPKLVYLNKMDKPRSNYERCLADISKFKTSHLLLQLPVFKSDRFAGVIDLIRLERNIWNLKENAMGVLVESKKLSEQDAEYRRALELKEELIGRLCEFDGELSEQMFSTDNLLDLPEQLIVNSIRKATIQNQVVPVLMGSSFKNVGIQLLMNAVTRYLPSPLEKNERISRLANGQTSGFLFKVKYDKKLGPLFFVRIYDGEIKPNIKLLNYSKNKEEQIDRIYKVFGDDYTEVRTAKKGDIVALSGLQHSSNGDFFVQHREMFRRVENFVNDSENVLTPGEEIVLKGLKFPEPVIFCSVEAPSPSKELQLEQALKRLQQEDPSFSVAFNKDTNQTILRGMGDLHLQVIKDRIKRDFKLDAYYGNLQIAYLETLESPLDHELQFDKVIKDSKNSVFMRLVLKPKEPKSSTMTVTNEMINDSTSKILKVVVNDENELWKLSMTKKKLIVRGIQLAIDAGPLLGNKVVNLTAELHDFKTTSKTLDTVVISAAYECVKQAFKKSSSSFYLLEPIMKMDIEFPERNYSVLINELANRRAAIGELKSVDDDRQALSVLIPFAETIDLSNKIRSITSGNAHFTMQVDNYLPVNKSDEAKIIDEAKYGQALS